MPVGLLGLGGRRDDPSYGIPSTVGINRPTAIPSYAPAVPAGPKPLPPITTTNGVPNPNAASAASIAANQQNSQYNNALTHGSTTTPLGSQTYTSHIDPATGAIVYDTNVTLAPDQQKLLDLQNQQSLALGNTASGMLGKIGSAYGSPTPTNPYSWNDFGTERQRVEDALYKQNTQYLDPQFAKEKEALGQQLASQGIVSGSQAWTDAMNNFNQRSQSAYGDARQSAISGSGNEATLFGNAGEQQLRDALISRNEPLSEYNALRGAAPVNIPQFNPAQTPLAQNTDVAGNAYKSADAMIQQQAIAAGNRNAVTSGLFGLGSQFLGSKLGQDLIGQGISKIGGYFGLGSSAPAGTAGIGTGTVAGGGSAAAAGGGAAAGGAGGLGEISVGPATWGAGADAGGVYGSSAVGLGEGAAGGGGAVAGGGAAAGEGAAAGGGTGAGAAAGVSAGAAAIALPTVLALTTQPYKMNADWWNSLSNQLTTGKSGKNATYDANTPPEQQKYNARKALYQLIQAGPTHNLLGSAGQSVPPNIVALAKSYGMVDAAGNLNPNWNPGPMPARAGQPLTGQAYMDALGAYTGKPTAPISPATAMPTPGGPAGRAY